MDTIETQGRKYRYDPDYDCYIRVYDEQPVSTSTRIVCAILFTAMTAFSAWMIYNDYN